MGLWPLQGILFLGAYIGKSMGEGAELDFPSLKRKDFPTIRVFAEGVIASRGSGREVAFYHGRGSKAPKSSVGRV